MAESVRSCAGGVVFCDDDVFILMSDRGEWVMPKGVIRSSNRSNDVALWRVEDESGIHAEIIGIAGNTRYDFYSEGRGRNVSNRIQWFAMRASDHSYHIAYEQGFLNGGYYPVEKALEMLTFPADRQIVLNAYAIYKKNCKSSNRA
ncbi:MAG: NUDIX domain-containing protein [Clostridia bacterium]|nr:NUDIX domain-containing protein [Clostridia bacterium]